MLKTTLMNLKSAQQKWLAGKSRYRTGGEMLQYKRRSPLKDVVVDVLVDFHSPILQSFPASVCLHPLITITSPVLSQKRHNHSKTRNYYGKTLLPGAWALLWRTRWLCLRMIKSHVTCWEHLIGQYHIGVELAVFTNITTCLHSEHLLKLQAWNELPRDAVYLDWGQIWQF